MTVKKAGDHAITRDSLYGTISEPTYAGATIIHAAQVHAGPGWRRYSRNGRAA